MDKYQALRDAGTNGINYDLDTDAIIEHLRGWDQTYGITIGDVSHDAVVVEFSQVPDDASELAEDVEQFCPDMVSQHFGCFVEMLDTAEETGQDVPPEMLELTKGIDLEDENYGRELLKRSLERTRKVALWWD